MLPATRTPSQLRAVVRRGILAGLLLPGLLVVNLLCLCAHHAAAADEPARPNHCEAHAAGGSPRTGGASLPHGDGERDDACPHCGEGSALFASPRMASALSTPAPLLVAAPVHPVAFAVAPVTGRWLRASPGEHVPPALFARNSILRI
jgi:hypothetical protein